MDYSRYQIYEFFFDLKQEFKMYRDSILDEYDYGPIYANLYNMPEKLVDIFWEEYIYPTIVPEDPPNIMSFDQNAKHNQIIDILEKEYYIENIDFNEVLKTPVSLPQFKPQTPPQPPPEQPETGKV